MIMRAAIKPALKLWRDLRRVQRDFARDRCAVAAIEFAFILPLMLVSFFGAVNFSQGLAVSRKVTLTASALANLTSEMPNNGNIAPISDPDLQNNFTAGLYIINPYQTAPTHAQITELYVDKSGNASVQWSKGATFPNGAVQATLVNSGHNVGDIVTIPTALATPHTYLILSEVSYQFTPMADYGGLMSMAGVNLSDIAYSRPRQATCLVYNGTQPTPVNGNCPTTN
jgi:Flp pilus assembly protein TadG